ncbi:MAG: deoxyribose-phosphate aldolase [Gammaproteobacteria bacterium]
MEWSEATKEYIDALEPVSVTPALKQKIMSLIDLTSLNESDTDADVAALFEKAHNILGHVAAVCIYPQFVSLAATQFAGSPVKVATVVNFPNGDHSLKIVLTEINRALQSGAQEIDVVFPYERYLAGERQYVKTFVETCKAACGHAVTLKVILETGALSDLAVIADASYDVLAAGADFIKTSTGKIAEGATLEAVATMLLVIKHINTQLKHPVGLKVSGGVRTIEQAAQFVKLAESILGSSWLSPARLRLGVSKLVDALLEDKK